MRALLAFHAHAGDRRFTPPPATVIMEEAIISMSTILVGIISAGTTANTTRFVQSQIQGPHASL